MSSRNRQVVDEIINVVEDGLQDFVLRQYKQRYSAQSYLNKLSLTLDIDPPLESEEQAIREIESPGWLTAIWNQKQVFSSKLGMNRRVRDHNAKNGLNYVAEMINARNRYSHRSQLNTFKDEDVYSVADSANRLLKVVTAREKADIVKAIKLEYGRNIYGSEDTQAEAELEQVAPAVPDDLVSAQQPPESQAEDDSEQASVRVDLRGFNLSGMDLRDRNLHLASLKGADLSGSNLEYVQLAHVDLSNTKLSKSNLTEAKLTGSNLSLADLSEASLEYANLTESNLSHAMMEKADLRGANVDGTDFSYADLTKADFSNSTKEYGYFINGLENYDEYIGIIRSETNFSYAILRQAIMQRTFFEDVNLTQADLTEADFTGGRIASGSTFAGAILDSANLSNCELLSCNFSNARMNGVNLSGVRYCVHSTFTNAEMSGANLENFYIDPDNIDDEYHWDNVNLSGACLTGASLPRQSFRNANLTGAVFRDANLSYADLSHADLMDADFTGAELWCVNFTGSKFRYTTILPDGSYWNDDTDMTNFTGPLKDC